MKRLSFSKAGTIIAISAGLAAGAVRADITGFSGFAPVNITGGTLTNGIGYSANGNSFELNDNGGGEGVSGYNSAAQNISAFTLSYTYVTIPGITNYNGSTTTQTVQADGGFLSFLSATTGSTSQLGDTGGSFGYAGGTTTTNSAAIGFNLFNGVTNYGGGSEFLTGASNTATATTIGPNLSSADSMQVRVTYFGTTLTQTIADLTTGTASTKTYTGVNLASTLGTTSALIGFTGGTGGFTTAQTVSNFKFNSVTGTYQPIALTGFTQATVVPAGASTTTPYNSITATMDSGTAKGGGTFYETGYNTAATNTGLPASGSTFTSQNDAQHVFKMQSYAGSCALLLNTSTPNGTLALTTPTAFKGLSILMADGNGTQPFNLTINFTNGTSETINGATSPDWFNNGTIAYDAQGRTNSTGGFDTVNGNNPNLYQVDVALTDQTDKVSSLTFAYEGSLSSTAQMTIYGVSGLYAVPEPSSVAALGLGGLGAMFAFARGRKARQGC